jgi:hypothetical protein
MVGKGFACGSAFHPFAARLFGGCGIGFRRTAVGKPAVGPSRGQSAGLVRRLEEVGKGVNGLSGIEEGHVRADIERRPRVGVPGRSLEYLERSSSLSEGCDVPVA